MEQEETIDWKKRYFQLLDRLTSLESEVKALRQENQELRLENKALKAKVKELEDKLNTNSRNSSKPPSQDPFRPKNSRKSSNKTQGAQPGHMGHKKKMYPMDEVTKIVELKPDICTDCDCTDFNKAPVSIECRQTVELPAIKPEVTQYNICTCRCNRCGKDTRPEVPKEAERGFGPRLMGFLTMLSGEAKVTKRKICSIAAHLGIKISLGALCNIHRLAADILKGPFEEVREAVLREKNVNADETSWRLKSKKCWIWIGATPVATFFSIDPSRSREAFERIFRTYQNTLSSDRYGAYRRYKGVKQSCLAHIDRDFKKVSERKGADGALGRILSGELGLIFSLWKQFKNEALSRKELQTQAEIHVKNIKDTLTVLASAKEIQSKSRNLGKNLLNCFSTLWVFLYEEGVEPTNNLAERGLRPAVIWRKISGGSQSDWGLNFTERLLTVSFTLRQRSGNLFEFLSRAFDAHLKGSSIPLLLDSS